MNPVNVIQDGDLWVNQFKNLYRNIHIKSDSEQTQITENVNKLELKTPRTH